MVTAWRHVPSLGTATMPSTWLEYCNGEGDKFLLQKQAAVSSQGSPGLPRLAQQLEMLWTYDTFADVIPFLNEDYNPPLAHHTYCSRLRS
jgi:hypothetical protein